jgi:hypothetical protein
VTATSAASAWAVGSSGSQQPGWPFILHWNGTAWTQADAPHLKGDRRRAARRGRRLRCERVGGRRCNGPRRTAHPHPALERDRMDARAQPQPGRPRPR